MKEFQAGQKIRTISGGEVEVVQKLGEGGQGIVYKVNYNGRPLALKWYFAEKIDNQKAFYENLKRNIENGAPTDAFLWPQELTEYFEGSFGYLMELRPSDYKDFSAFLLTKARFSGIGAVVNAALCISNGFRDLHRRGCSYQDLNDGNFFVNPQNGDVLICDNDNVAPEGENLGIAGKCGYMAPEVVTRKKLPDKHTDRFSLAVILYRLLFLDHPLEGRRTQVPCMTEKHDRQFYGTEPLFTWDPQNETNRPVRGIHSNTIRLWPLYPKFVRDAFERAFSQEALIGEDIEHRVTETEWQKLFTRLRDLLIKCDSCGEETFVDPDADAYTCICCGKTVRRPMVLKTRQYRVAMTPPNKLYTCHVRDDDDDFRKVEGEVVTSRSTPVVIGLKNLSSRDWEAVLPSGDRKVFRNGDVIKLDKGVTIKFGSNSVAEIV